MLRTAKRINAMIYLDNSATTRVLDSAAETAARCMQEEFFNPSSAYGPAAAAERRVNEARGRLAATLGCQGEEIVYTSGGTESNNTAIFGTLRAHRGKGRIITSQSEHPSVYEVCRLLEQQYGYEVVYLGSDCEGRVSMQALAESLTPDTALVSLMHVNNETGAITDIAAAQALIQKRAPQAVFHVDGVQAYGKLPFSRVPCDLYSISGHKIHAPKGVGALYVHSGLHFAGGLIGGGQELGRRSGTTNTPGILGMDAAVSAYRAHQAEWIAAMRACKLRLAKNLAALPDALINGPTPADGAPHILNVSFLGVRGEVLLHALEQRGIYVSTGSACSTHKKGKNRVLAAIGVVGARQEGALRFSLCPFNTLDEMDETAAEIEKQIAFLRRYQRR